jgi:hypothetical protein
MPYLGQEHTLGTNQMETPLPSTPLSPGEQELRQATRHFCAEKSEAHLRAVLELRLTMQARTCALWGTNYDKDFTLRGTEWVSTRGLEGPCGVMETAVFSSTLYDSHGQDIRFHRYRTRHRVAKHRAPQYTVGEDHDYVVVLDKPRSLNLSHFVARQIWRRHGMFPLRCRAHRLQRREPL